jgi:hypothetical protein
MIMIRDLTYIRAWLGDAWSNPFRDLEGNQRRPAVVIDASLAECSKFLKIQLEEYMNEGDEFWQKEGMENETYIVWKKPEGHPRSMNNPNWEERKDAAEPYCRVISLKMITQETTSYEIYPRTESGFLRDFRENESQWIKIVNGHMKSTFSKMHGVMCASCGCRIRMPCKTQTYPPTSQRHLK